MGSSNKKKKEKKKDFQKAKLKVGKAKAKAANFTDTSFKSKSIVVNQQTLVSDGLDSAEQFKQNLASCISAKSDHQRREAVAYITNQISLNPPNNPVGTSGVLTKLLPLMSDTAGPVRAQLLKLFRALPASEVGPEVEKILMYIRGGMTHLSTDIRSDTLNVLDWLLEVAGEEAVSCPGGWLKTLNSFSSMLGWNPSVGSAMTSKGWTNAPKATLGTEKGPESRARQLESLARFLQAGFRAEAPVEPNPSEYWDNIYRLPSTPNPFAYLNLFGVPRDEDNEMYQDRSSRQRVFDAKWRPAITSGMDGSRKEGGTVGRAAAALGRALSTGLDIEVVDSEMMDRYRSHSVPSIPSPTLLTFTYSPPQSLIGCCWGEPAEASNSFDNNSDMKNALIDAQAAPSGDENAESVPNHTPQQGFNLAGENWTKSGTSTSYNYAEFADGAEHEWAGNAQVYEFTDEFGDVGPEHPDLEVQLFGEPETRIKQGGDFETITSLELFQEGEVRVEPIINFDHAGLHPVMRRNVELAGYMVPTPIQRYTLPAIKMGYDVIAVAQTGSGKTAAYLIPILNKLMGKAKKLAAGRPNPATYREGIDPPSRAEPLVVVVCPSRELAVQVFNEARKFCYRTMLRPCVVYGGGPLRDQAMQLHKGCDVLIATPGRLGDFLDRPETLTFRRVRYMVFDEADEMLQDDWNEEVGKILSGGEQDEGNINYMLFSATFPKAARDLAKNHLAENHVRLRVGRAGSSHRNIKQVVMQTEPHEKKQTLVDLLNSLPPTRTIIFVNNKRTADELDDLLFNLKFPCTSMHSDRTQREREAAMRGFRAGNFPILITTGVSARGIDVRNVMHVINYDLPSIDHGGIEEYTHRIGRTGRIGHRGLATSFYTDRDEGLASVLTRTLLETNQEIPEFLQSYIPEGMTKENLKFEADSDFDENDIAGAGDAGGDTGGGAWGGDGGGDTAAEEVAEPW
ncbi:DEAD/DEAH box RNA helicase [Podospora australis]|uniref:Pre-rRNA-processing protein IPI1 n=1 Tax=Podospora australis TaxID=1536484 RepID=A0AAN6WW58_9PEZI|nr:DEAD/DEAH box RNA helicase [Podospora australis]